MKPLKSARKPFNNEPGYVAMRKCYTTGAEGYIVLYDTEKGATIAPSAPDRWLVVHTGIGKYLSVPTLLQARAIMDEAARAYKEPPKYFARAKVVSK